MPWDAASFRKHNHSLSPTQSGHAASIANAILKQSGNEGMAIATANKLAKRATGGMVRRDDGGSLNLVDPTSSTLGGLSPSSSTMNPMVRAMVQRYSALSTERLQELATMLGNSSQGQIVQAVLRQKQSNPSSQQQSTGQQQQGQGQSQGQGQGQSQGQAFQPTQLAQQMQAGTSGGMQPQQGFQSGGSPLGVSLSMADPYWSRQALSSSEHTSTGFLNGLSGGRTDAVKTQAPSGSYVLPSDVISGLGQGNSLAGAKVVQEMLSTGPHGTPLPRITHGSGPPRPPHLASEAKGGGVQSSVGDVTPVALSHGEYVLTPHEVARIGGGDVKRGHKILDHFVVEMRRRQIAKLKQLKPPVGMKRKAA